MARELENYRGIQVATAVAGYESDPDCPLMGYVVVPDSEAEGGLKGGRGMPELKVAEYDTSNGQSRVVNEIVIPSLPRHGQGQTASTARRARTRAKTDAKTRRKVRIETPMGTLNTEMSAVVEDGVTLALIGTDYEPVVADGVTLGIESGGSRWEAMPIGMAFTHPGTNERIVILVVV
jgi:hypothetical protein